VKFSGQFPQSHCLNRAQLNAKNFTEMKTDSLSQLNLQNEPARSIERAAVMREGVTFECAKKYVQRWHDSYQRLPEILDLYEFMEPLDWWKLLGMLWTICDNVGHFKTQLFDHLMFASPEELRAAMRPNEWRTLRSLPEDLTVYRGCYEVNKDGLSWSLSEKIARTFPSMLRYARPGEDALLLVGTVPRDCVFLKLDRREREVVSACVEIESESILEV
jgi:hypothetical protein